MVRAEQDAILRGLWARVSVQEAARADLWEIVRHRARVDNKAQQARPLRRQELRALGNACVPAQAALAWTMLWRQLAAKAPRHSPLPIT